MLNILLEASPLDNGTPTTIRMSSAAVLSDGVQVDGLEWLPVITSVPSPNYSISAGSGEIGPMTISMGSVSFRIGARYGNREWNKLSWVGAPVALWIGDASKPFSEYRQFFTGTLSGLARTGNTAELALRTVEGQLDVPLLSKRYAGTGGSEGPAGKKGTLKPYCLGNARIVAPVEVDPARLVYQVHGYGPVADIPQVYEFAQPLEASKGDVAIWDQLVAADLKPGEWMTCKALGMFRLGGRPDKKLSADVLGGSLAGNAPMTVAGIIPMLLQEAGVSPQRIGDMSALNFQWSLYATDDITVADAVKQAALDAGGYIFADKNGNWQCGRHRTPKPATDLLVDRTAEPLVQTINELNVTDPTWKVEIGYDPCWNVHSESDISPKLLELEGKIVAADEVLDSIKEQADQAVANAAAAKAEIEAMLADGILDRSDKRRVIDRLEAERVRHDQLEGVYGAYDVQVEWNAYDAAWNSVEAYITGLTPSIYDNSANTPVERSTYLAQWAQYEITLQTLLNKITGRAGETSLWDGVSGPGKPENYATVGAPAGTPVGGVPAEDIADAVKDENGIVKPARDLVAEAKAAIDAEVASAKSDANQAKADANQAKQQLADAKTQLEADIATARTAADQAKADAAQVRSDLTPDVNTAKQDAANARSDAAQARTDLTNEVARAQQEEGAIRQTVTNLTQTVGDNNSAVNDQITILTGADSALATRAQNLETSVNNASTGNTALDARLKTEIVARATADQVATTRITSMESRVGAPEALNNNAAFTSYVGGNGTASGPPTPWIANTAYANGITSYTGSVGFIVPVDYECYFAGYTSPIQVNTWVVLEMAIYTQSGDLRGAGTMLRVGGTDFKLAFATDPDITGKVWGASVPANGLNLTFRKLIKITTSDAQPLIYCASRAHFLDSANTVSRFTVTKCQVRHATQAEVDSNQAMSDAAAAKADAATALTNAGFAVSKINEEVTTRTQQNDALSNRLNTLEAQVGGSEGSSLSTRLTNEETARATGDTALGNRITTIETNYINADDAANIANAKVADEATARSNADGALGNRIGSIEADYVTGNGANSIATTVAQAKVADEATARSNADGALSNRIGSIEADYVTNGSAASIAQAKVNDEATTRANADGALGNRIGSIEADYVTNGAANSIAQAKVNDEATARSNADSALGNRITSTEAKLNGGEDSWVAGRIRDEATASANRDSALGNRISTTEAQFRGEQDSGLKTLINNKRSNLALVDWWKAGAGIPWGLNGGQENSLISWPHPSWPTLAGPDGGSGDVWLCRADGSGHGAGGWDGGQMAPLDPDKTYRFMVPIMTLDTGYNRTSYWGTNGVCDLNTTTHNTNPYFAVVGNMTPNKWHLFVGFIFPRNSTGKTNDGSGVWDMTTGIKIIGGQNYCFHPYGWQPTHRAYQYYATNGAYQLFGRPIVEVVDGSEANIASAFNAAQAASTANARISDEATASANRDSALSNRVSTTEANYNSARTDINNLITDNGNRYNEIVAANARIGTEETARASADSAISNRANVLETSFTGNSGLVLNGSFTSNADGWGLSGCSWVDNPGDMQGAIRSTGDASFSSLHFMAINPNHSYRMEVRFAARGTGIVQYAGLECYDVNKNFLGNLYMPEVAGQAFGWDMYERSTTFSGANNPTSPFYGASYNIPIQCKFAKPLFLMNYQGYGSAGSIVDVDYIRIVDVTENQATNAKITDEATTRSNADSALGNRISSTEAKLSGGEDSWLAARIRDEATASVNREAAVANRASVLEANAVAALNTINRNAKFSMWPDPNGLPTGWTWWSSSSSCSRYTTPNASGGYAFRHIAPQDLATGLMQSGCQIHPGWYVLEADIELLDGTLYGAGLTLSGVHSLDFAREPDVNGEIGGGGYRRRRFSKLIRVTSFVDNWHAMTNWGGFSTLNYKYVDWYYAGVRPATDGEIRAQKAEDLLGGIRSSDLQSRIATEETTRANGVSAVANRTTSLEVTASKAGYLNNNATFTQNGWDAQYSPPPGWAYWAQDGNPYIGWHTAQTPNNYGGRYPVQIDRQGNNCGIYHSFGGQYPKGWYVLEAELRFEDGYVQGSGMHCNWNNGYSNQINFHNDPDINGQTGDIRGNRKFTKLVENPTDSTVISFYMMAGWTGFNFSYHGFLRTIWQKAGIRPATKQEIDSGKVVNLDARVSTTESAITNLNGRASSYWQVQSVAGNNRAQITVRSDSNGGAGVDIVGDVNFSGNLNVGPDSGERVKITNQGVFGFFGNGNPSFRLGRW